MAHRTQQKEAARQARLRAQAERERTERRQKRLRRTGYGAVGLIAAVLVALAVGLNGNGRQAPASAMSATGGSGPGVGASAPNFSLENVVSGKSVSLASLRGHKTLMFFSEGVGCQACLVQAADLQKDATLRRAGIQLVSVTTDQPGDLAQAASQYGITTPLLADPSTQMSSAYGMLGHGGMEHPTQDGHAFLLVGADGKVLWHQAYQDMYVQPSQLVHDMGARVSS
jgi:peroxiredoxin Q/BCP